MKSFPSLLLIPFFSLGLMACAPALDGDATAEPAAAVAMPARAAAPAPTPAVCRDCGTVSAIETVQEKGEGSGAGALAGAVLGGVIGHQFGGGRGKDAATAVGAIGGAMAGHEVEKNVKSTTYYRVTVRMEDGGTRSVNVGSTAGIAVGTPVRVVGNNLELRA